MALSTLIPPERERHLGEPNKVPAAEAHGMVHSSTEQLLEVPEVLAIRRTKR
jgi:hypothetical protein